MIDSKKALIFILLAVVCGTVMDVLLKIAGQHMGTWQLLSLRWLFALVVLAPVLLGGRSGGMKVHSSKVHIARGILNCIGSYALFYALATLPLSLVISILFAEPLFVIPISILILRERVTAKGVLSALLGLTGVLVMSQPNAAQGDWRVVFPAIAAFCFALLNVVTKKWGHQESPFSLMLWLAMSTLLITLPFALGEWKALDATDYLLILGIAVSGSVYSFFWIVGLRLGNVAKLTQISFLSLPLAFIAGWTFFGEQPGASTNIGGAIILAAVALTTIQLPSLRLTKKGAI